MGRHSGQPDARYYAQLDIDEWVGELGGRLDARDRSAADDALDFLERDPYFFRSGYARGRVARRLARADLNPRQRERARNVVLTTVDGERHCPVADVARLAHEVADNGLRWALRNRLHSPDPAVVRRALQVITRVRHPGLRPEDLAAARRLVLTDAARGDWLQPETARLARSVWSPEWETELRDLAGPHGPDRAAARRLLQDADDRRERRTDR